MIEYKKVWTRKPQGVTYGSSLTGIPQTVVKYYKKLSSQPWDFVEISEAEYNQSQNKEVNIKTIKDFLEVKDES